MPKITTPDAPSEGASTSSSRDDLILEEVVQYSDEFDANSFLKTLTTLPGVYRMIGGKEEVLYVGKARNLKRRVASYFRANPDSGKIRRLVSQIRRIEITVTHTEVEALLLESNLIKQHQPRYNVLLRDDKGYPYIHLSADEHPRLVFHRGPRNKAGRYFGPYPSAGAVRDTLYQMQRAFRLRSCDNSFFAHRSRPCLQYQIKRCSGPCTGMIDPADYRRDVEDAVRFLEGKSDQVIAALVQRMEGAADTLNFERAAVLRDQIAQLRRIQQRQYVSNERGDLDVIACALREDVACIQVLFFRDGRLLGNRPFFPRLPDEESVEGVLSAFLSQYYLDKTIPREILVDRELKDAPLLAQLFQQRMGYGVTLSHRLRGDRARWLALASRNAEQALSAQLASKSGMQRRFVALQELLELAEPPGRIECFDISHTGGEATVAACVVFNADGPLKSDYRRYNITEVAAGDDYGAMRQALLRRYTKLVAGEGKLPDLLLIDGGRGQLAQALAVLEELQIDGVIAMGVSKGRDRKAGQEVLFCGDDPTPLLLPSHSPALHLIQQVRDEAHRFAITGHRQRRSQARRASPLEGVAGIGPKRRQRLLQQFGGMRQLARAGIEDIARIDGISRDLAARIYAAFHEEEGE